MSLQAELQRACSLYMGLQAAEVATLKAFLAEPASDRLRDSLSMLRLELNRKQCEVVTLVEAMRLEEFEITGEVEP